MLSTETADVRKAGSFELKIESADTRKFNADSEYACDDSFTLDRLAKS